MGLGQRFERADGRAVLSIYARSNDAGETPRTYLRKHLRVERSELDYVRIAPSFFAISSERDGVILYSRCNFSGDRDHNLKCVHYKLGHHPMGGKFFRNHINFHHVHYSKNHLVSRTYLGDEGNNTPFFFIPVFLIGACTYLLLPVDLFVAQLVACAASFYAHVFFEKEYHIEGSRLQRFAWFRRKQELHFVHHRHANSNFAVIHFFWDRILGTYRRPDVGQTQANGTLRTGGPGRFPPFETDAGIEVSMLLHESRMGASHNDR
jgi:hypothetical protein